MGRIVAPYGVKGWLKVVPSTAERETLLSHKEWWLRPRGEGSEWRHCTLEEGRPPALTGTEAAKAIHIIDACYQSARCGRPVKIQ